MTQEPYKRFPRVSDCYHWPVRIVCEADGTKYAQCTNPDCKSDKKTCDVVADEGLAPTPADREKEKGIKVKNWFYQEPTQEHRTSKGERFAEDVLKEIASWNEHKRNWLIENLKSKKEISSQLTEEDRGLLKNWEGEFYEIWRNKTYVDELEFITTLLALKDREADERVRLERERCAEIVKEYCYPDDGFMITGARWGNNMDDFKMMRRNAKEAETQILNPPKE